MNMESLHFFPRRNRLLGQKIAQDGKTFVEDRWMQLIGYTLH